MQQLKATDLLLYTATCMDHKNTVKENKAMCNIISCT